MSIVFLQKLSLDCSCSLDATCFQCCTMLSSTGVSTWLMMISFLDPEHKQEDPRKMDLGSPKGGCCLGGEEDVMRNGEGEEQGGA